MEYWAPIEEFHGKYEVSNFGNVRRAARPKYLDSRGREWGGPEKFIKIHINHSGYNVVNLYDVNGTLRKRRVARLVAQAFVDNPYNKPEVNHIDENRSNDTYMNLEWVTRSEQLSHGRYKENMRNTMITKMECGEPQGIAANFNSIKGTDLSTGTVKHYRSQSATREDDFNPYCVGLCAKGIRKSHKGWMWEFI